MHAPQRTGLKNGGVGVALFDFKRQLRYIKVNSGEYKWTYRRQFDGDCEMAQSPRFQRASPRRRIVPKLRPLAKLLYDVLLEDATHQLDAQSVRT